MLILTSTQHPFGKSAPTGLGAERWIVEHLEAVPDGENQSTITVDKAGSKLSEESAATHGSGAGGRWLFFDQ